MYQLLLVEDEDIIRNGLRHMIEKLNLEPINIIEACNGVEAIETIKETVPHIVITDIRMPLMDGLELIANLKDLLPNAELIILSGYSEFEYAKKAITLGVKEYLLKPIKKEQLATILCQIMNRMKEQEMEQLKLSQTLSNFSKEVSHLQKSLLWKILNSEYSPKQPFSEITDLGIQFPCKYFILLALRIVRSSELTSFDEALHLVEEKLRKTCTPLFRFTSEYGYIFYLFNLPSHSYNGLEEFLSEYQKIPQSLSMGISEVVDSPELLPLLLKQARSALDNRLFYFDTKCFFYHDFHYTGSGTVFSSQVGEKILLALNKGNGAAALLIKEFFLQLLETSEVTAEWIALNIKALFYYIFSTKMIENKIKKTPWELDETIEFFFSVADTFADFSNTVVEQMLGLEKNNSSSNTQNATVTQAINYVQKYYKKDISLVYISNFVSMNDSYFSSLFKKTTGIGFANYLQDVRIQNSKRLLRDPSIKIYEVAEMVGFRDEKYFYKVFKKITGITPSDYKNSANFHYND